MLKSEMIQTSEQYLKIIDTKKHADSIKLSNAKTKTKIIFSKM